MTEIRTVEKVFWTEFIELYRQHPCLWKLDCKDYTDRGKKTRAYEVLAKKLREYDTNATRDTVTKKINCLRSSHRKEMKKVVKSREESSEGPIYKPNLWYYDLMSFLEEHISLRPSKTSVSGDSEEVEVCPDTKEYVDESEALPDYDEPPPSTSPPPVLPSSSHTRSHPHMKREHHQISSPNLTPPSSDRNNPFAPHRKEDEWDLVGRNVATKLRKLPDSQRIFAERLINEVLFQGQVKGLNISTALTTNSRRKNYNEDDSYNGIGD